MSQKNSKKNPKSYEEPPELDELDEKLLDKIWDKQAKLSPPKSEDKSSKRTR